MEEKELNLIVEKIGVEQKAQFDTMKEELAQGFITDEAFKTSMEEFAEKNNVEGLSESIEKLGIDLKKMKELEDSKEPISVKSQIESKLEDIRESVKEQKPFVLDLKTDVTSASVTSDSTGTYLPGFGQAAFKATVMEGLFANFSIPSGRKTVYWQDQTTVTRGAETAAEAGTMAESALAWTQYSANVEKILDSIPMTMEALSDIDGVVAEIEQFLRTNMALKIDSQLWSGDDSTPNWNGIYTQSTDFTTAVVTAGISAGTLAQTDDCSIYDLLMNMLTYIANGKESKFQGNLILMNPVDILKAKLKKDANNNYIIPPFVSRDGMIVNGANIVETSAVTANTLAVGDRRYPRYYNVGGVELEFGFHTDDFAKDRISLKARKRGQLVLRNVDATAFYKVTDISTRVGDLTA